MRDRHARRIVRRLAVTAFVALTCGLGQGRANAAEPFGWASVVADIELSGGATRRVPAASQSDAVTIIVQDIDHDDDLDIVVVVPSLTLEVVVAAWLNDGAGRFNRARLRELPIHVPPHHAFSREASASPAQDLEASPRAVHACLPGARGCVGRPAACGIAQSAQPLAVECFAGSTTASRAPPRSL